MRIGSICDCSFVGIGPAALTGARELGLKRYLEHRWLARMVAREDTDWVQKFNNSNKSAGGCRVIF
jgi:hypothetical protein